MLVYLFDQSSLIVIDSVEEETKSSSQNSTFDQPQRHKYKRQTYVACARMVILSAELDSQAYEEDEKWKPQQQHTDVVEPDFLECTQQGAHKKGEKHAPNRNKDNAPWEQNK